MTTLDFGVFKKLSLPYIAGLLDGEGCITLLRGGKKQTGAPAVLVTITGTHKPVLLAVQNTIGGRLYKNVKYRGKAWKPVYRLTWNSWTEGQAIVRQLRQWLIIKAPQADLLLSLPPRIRRAPKGQDVSAYWKALEKFRKLNKRGPR